MLWYVMVCYGMIGSYLHIY